MSEDEDNAKLQNQFFANAIGLVFLLFLCRTENLIIQWVLENVLIETCHESKIYYSGIGAS